jgi:hypothetical protein
MLQAELSRAANAGWAEAMAPLAAAFVDRFQAFLPLATYPVRVGTHFNTAFALALASEYAEASGDASLRVCSATRRWPGTATTPTARLGSPRATTSSRPR